MLRVAFQGMLLAAIVGAAAFSTRVQPAVAAFPQPSWPNDDSADVVRCTSAPGTGPQNLSGAFVWFAGSGPGAFVSGNYIGFVCNFELTRAGSGFKAGVAVTVDYCGGPTQAPKREENQDGYDVFGEQFYTVRSQRWVTHNGALLVIVVYTNEHGNVDDFTTQEMVSGAQSLADLNRPQGAVPCPGGGTTQDPGGGSGNWAVTLSANKTDLIAGNDFTLTATANKSTAGTGFAIFIQNNTDGEIVFCQNVTICTHKDFKNEPGTRTYQAFIANLQGQNVQAASQPVVVGWNEWTGNVVLTVDDDDIDSGDVVHFSASANPTINATIYAIRIERQDGGHLVATCFETPCTGTDTYESGVSYNYVAKVVKQDGTGLRATSPAVKVTWKATEEWHGTVGIRTAGGRNTVRIGTPVVVEAFASPDLQGTDLVLTIAEERQGGGGQSGTCDAVLLEECRMVVNSDEQTSRFFRAIVHKRDGSGDPAAVSEFLLTISWTADGPSQACEDGWRATSVTGSATVIIGGSQRVPLKPGQWICPKDTVETGPGSEVVGAYAERGLFNPNIGRDAEVRVRPNTQLTLDFFSQGTVNTYYNMETGKTEWFVNGTAPSDFRIKSPTCAVSVRGTHFLVEIDAKTGATHVEVYHGRVEVTPDNPDLAPRTLAPGDQVTVGEETASSVTKIYGTLAHRRLLPALTREGSN